MAEIEDSETNSNVRVINPDEEYECQFYGFSSTSVLEGIKDILNQVTESILESMERRILSKYDFESDSVEETKRGLLEAYKESIERHSEDLKEIIQQYFAIPKDIILPEDEEQKIQYSKADETELDTQLKSSREKLLALSAFERKLEDTVDQIRDYKVISEKLIESVQYSERLNLKCQQFQQSVIPVIPTMALFTEQCLLNFANINLSE